MIYFIVMESTFKKKIEILAYTFFLKFLGPEMKMALPEWVRVELPVPSFFT
jgi:hypothetical protein